MAGGIAVAVLAAVSLVRSADMDDLRQRDAAVQAQIAMEIQERKDLAEEVRGIRDLQQRNTAKIEWLEKELEK